VLNHCLKWYNIVTVLQGVLPWSVSDRKGPWTPKFTYHFPKRAPFSGNFDSNIGTQCFVSTKKLTFEIDSLRKWRRKRDAVFTGWWRTGWCTRSQRKIRTET